jgi:S-(hydroxymethyl)glutathione dehydrogenase/alcohol dehydrogenase
VNAAESVVVFGVGGVGLNVIQFAAMVGANPVIAVDRLDNKLEMARRFGATHAINSDTSKDVAGAIRGLDDRFHETCIMEPMG